MPIAFCLFHITNMIDASFLAMTGTPPIWNDDWAAKVNMTINDHGKHRTVDEMVNQRIGDYDAFKEYMRAVFTRTEDWLDQLDPAELTRVVDHPTRSRRRSRAPTAPGSRDPRASRSSTRPSAGSTSTACATWARSSSPAASSACRG